jgi:hypothetical protein
MHVNWGWEKCALHAAVAIVTLLLCVFSAQAQHHDGNARPAPHFSAPSARNSQPSFSANHAPGSHAPQATTPATAGYSGEHAIPAYSFGTQHTAPAQSHSAQAPGAAQPRPPAYGTAGAPRAPYQSPNTHGPTPNAPNTAPSSPLGSWFNQRSNLPVTEQERMLRAEPGFNHLPTGEQQRLLRQLHNVDQMNEQQRQRRLQRSALIERMSPQERMNLKHSNQVFNALPANRQSLIKHAFQDLRSVPTDQRQTVLNSAHYQSAFSPEERAILGDFLRVEPYEPPH